MNTTPIPAVATAPTPRRRRLWPWIVTLCLLPFVVSAAIVLNFITLDGDAAALRRQVMNATDAHWHTKVQISVGRLTLGAVRTGLLFVHDKDMADARLALAAVRHASVGVYEASGKTTGWSREQLFAKTDRAMQSRGWIRLVGVADGQDSVLVYVPTDTNARTTVPVCLAVVSGRDLVVVSTSVDANQLAELVHRKAGDDIRRKLHLARL